MLLVGDKELMTKIGQSLPNTPMTLNGLLIRRYRQLQILTVDVFSMDGQPWVQTEKDPQRVGK
jgi:hypothetical protein